MACRKDQHLVLDREVVWTADKIRDLRLLRDEKSVADVGAPVLVVSQFTLYADTRKGRRPSWNAAAPGPVAEPLVEAFANGLPVIASRIGRLAEMVEPGRNGLLFEAGSARDLARRLAWAEAFPEKMRQMGECAKADYRARFLADWNYPILFGERRRAARV